MRIAWISAFLLLPVSSVTAEVFSHDTGSARWEAEVTADTFILKQTRQGAPAGGELVCPLGPAVRASVVRTVLDGSRVCLVFSRDKCAHKGVVEEGPATPGAQLSGMGVFKCVDTGSAEDATRLAALINAGSPARRPVSVPGPTTPSKSSKALAERGRGL